MKKNKNKLLQAKIQALNNQLNSRENKPKDIKESKESKEIQININKAIKRDLLKTALLIILSFGLLFLVKYLNTDFFFNKFF